MRFLWNGVEMVRVLSFYLKRRFWSIDLFYELNYLNFRIRI